MYLFDTTQNKFKIHFPKIDGPNSESIAKTFILLSLREHSLMTRYNTNCFILKYFYITSIPSNKSLQLNLLDFLYCIYIISDQFKYISFKGLKVHRPV